MMNNQTIMNKNFPHQKYLKQRNRYKSNEKNNFSPNNNINNINIIKNPNQNQNIKGSKNSNIYYINPKNNQNISTQNIAFLKQMKTKQNNQIYLEGDLNNFLNKNNNIYSYSNINKSKNNNMNNTQRISNINRAKKNRGIPRKSPIPIPKGFITGKYINNDNMSYVSKNSNKSNNSNNGSYYTVNSQLINSNYSISNLSKISGYSNNSYNNSNLINYGSIIDNDHIRAYSNNVHSSITQKILNENNDNIFINKNSTQNKSSNNILNRQNNNISAYTHKIKTNNYINNNINNFNNINKINKLKNQNGIKKPKYISKSPNPNGKDYLSYTIKRNNNNFLNPNNYNIINNNNSSNSNVNNINNINNINNNINNMNNENPMNKIGYRTSSNLDSNYYNNINIYEYSNYNKENDININHNKGRPSTSHSHNNKAHNRKLNNNNKNNQMIMSNQFELNSKDINLNNYNSNETNQRKNILLNNQNIINNNYIHQYNSHNIKRDYSAHIPNNRINIDRINNEYTNNLNNINPMVNLNIINKGQIINNNYSNINNMNSNMNNLYVYKYDISQNNILQGKYNTNHKKHSNNNIRKNNNSLINNNENINKINEFINNEININNNKKNIERQNLHKYNEKGVKIRSNSSSGIGITGELNSILNQRNNDKINLNLLNQKNLDLTKNNHINNHFYNNRPQIINNNINITKIKSPHKKVLIKQIRKIHHFTHVGFNGERDKDFNQDIAFLEKNFAGNNSYLYLAVCDGHGVEGHEVSAFIKRSLPKELSNSLYNKDILTNDKNVKKKIYNIIGQTFIKVNEKLISNESINSIFSGTTCVSVIYTPIKLICANIGDSRAVLGRFEKNLKKWVAINLSRDHKPTEEDEARRIFKKGGRIKPYVDLETGEEVGPQRVWVKDDEVPGLAMTRSFGDRVAAIAGTICIPEIKEYNFNEGDKFLILASDGVWEFIQSEECINIIGKFYLNNNIEGCCEYLYNESRKRWIKEEETVDDITMLLVFFD